MLNCPAATAVPAIAKTMAITPRATPARDFHSRFIPLPLSVWLSPELARRSLHLREQRNEAGVAHLGKGRAGRRRPLPEHSARAADAYDVGGEPEVWLTLA